MPKIATGIVVGLDGAYMFSKAKAERIAVPATHRAMLRFIPFRTPTHLTSIRDKDSNAKNDRVALPPTTPKMSGKSPPTVLLKTRLATIEVAPI